MSQQKSKNKVIKFYFNIKSSSYAYNVHEQWKIVSL